MSEAAINLLLQIPLAGVVVVVVWVFLKHISRYSDSMIAFLQAQESSMQNFIREQREQSNESIAQLAGEIKSIGQQVAQMNGTLQAHDAVSKIRAEGRARR